MSNAVLTYLEEQGEDISALYDHSPVPLEMLRDPSYWVKAPDLEIFFEQVHKLHLKSDQNILQSAGHAGFELRAWGVLDSVLKMMPHPQDVFLQPEQFLSYFISPKPPIENFHKLEQGVSFDLPLPAEQYPLVTEYLKAAFEALPTYVGQTMAKCEWVGISIKLQWQDRQEKILNSELGHQMSPQLFNGLLQDLQRTQREREDLQKYIADLEEKIRDFEKRQLLTVVQGDSTSAPVNVEGTLAHLDFDHAQPGYVIGQNLARMHDYMVRAQQLITMLIGQQKMNPAIKKAMQRTDWDFVKAQYPRTVAESMELLRKLQQQIQVQKEETQNVGDRERHLS